MPQSHTQIALLAPGQGSQSPGMLEPWLQLSGAAERVATWSEISGLDLARLGTTADADEITDTAVTQPLIVAATLLAHEEATRRLGERSDGGTTGLFGAGSADTVVAGHSVGEIAAYAIAGVISTDDAIKLAATRGAEMAKACALEPTGMAAVLGGDEADVLEALARFDLAPANRNAAGQIVAAGAVSALDKLTEDPPAKARVRRLATAGAFHTHYMASALGGYQAAAREVATTEPAPTVTLLSNADGQPVASAADAIEKLVAQLTRPVRWDLCTATMRQRFENAENAAIVEFPPAGTLVGIAKRELRGIATHAVKSPADLDGLTSL
ncbi:MAG: ACP S-malonyltransferase [Actinomycetota bacterium]|nr:ACP S-malonyltransferase [Actinomycetota bacterium]